MIVIKLVGMIGIHRSAKIISRTSSTACDFTVIEVLRRNANYSCWFTVCDPVSQLTVRSNLALYPCPPVYTLHGIPVIPKHSRPPLDDHLHFSKLRESCCLTSAAYLQFISLEDFPRFIKTGDSCIA